MGGGVARNDIFSLKERYYGPKEDILDYWVKLIFCLLSYYILSKDKFYIFEIMDMGRFCWNNGVSVKCNPNLSYRIR